MKTRSYSQINQEELGRTIDALADNKFANHATIRAVFIKKDDGSWQFFIGTCEIGVIRNDIEEIYSDSAFICKSDKEFHLMEFLELITSSGYLISSRSSLLIKTDQNNNTMWNEEIIPSHVTESGFPVRRYTSRITNGAYFHNSMLFGFNMPFHLSSNAYVKKFMGMRDFYGTDDARKGEFFIEVVDRRGRIFTDSGKVSIEGEDRELCLVGQTSEYSNINLHPGETLSCSEKQLNEAELWLITRENEILDFRSRTEWQYRLENVDVQEKRGAQLLAIIERGESQECEFKSYIDVSERGGKKADEIEKTVCALSNSQGGNLVIGVTDDGFIEGIDEMVMKTYQSDLEAAIDAYKKDLRKKLIEPLKDNQCFDIYAAKIGVKNIIVIAVKRSSKPNYNVHTRTGYIRKGATSFKMVSAEEREKMEGFPFFHQE